MWPRILLVPSLASAASDGTVPDPTALGGAIVIVAAAAVTLALAGTVLLVVRRRGPGSEMAIAAAERRTEVTDEKVAAALRRRTLNRGRVRFDDERVTAPRETLADDSTPRAIRRSG